MTTARGDHQSIPDDLLAEPLMTVEAAAARLGLARSSVYKLCARGELRWISIPGLRSRRLLRRDLEALVRNGLTGGWAAREHGDDRA